MKALAWLRNLNGRQWAFVLISLATLIRFGLALWWPWTIDEGLTYRHFTSQGWRMAISTYPFPNNHPLFSFITVLANQAPLPNLLAIRLISLVASVAVSWQFYRLAFRWFADGRALLALAVFVSSYPFFTLGFMARGYMLSLFMFLLMLNEAGRLINDRLTLTPKRALYLALVAALGYFTVPTFVYAHVAIMGWLTWVVIDRWNVAEVKALALHLLATVVFTLLFYSPMLYYTGLSEMMESLHPFIRPVNGVGDWLSHLAEVAYFAFSLAWPVGVVLAIWGIKQWAGPLRGPLAMSMVLPFFIPIVQGTVPYDRSWVHILPLAAMALASACPQQILSILRSAFFGFVLLALGTAQILFQTDHAFIAAQLQEQLERASCQSIATSSHLWGDYARFYAWFRHTGAQVTTMPDETAHGPSHEKFDCWVDEKGVLTKN